MTVEEATDFISRTLWMTLIIASPMLVVGLLVGIVISLVQAVTQIQEQTLSFVPKITAMFIAAIALMPWISGRLLEYAHAMFLTGQLP